MIFFILIFGLFVGSFLGVLVDRIPKNQSFIKGRSHCDKCKKDLIFLDLVPILSFIFLRGKCRYCHTRLPYFYPVIELATGILFALTYFLFNFQFPNFNFQLIYYLFLIASFIVIFFTDLKYGIIPDKIVFPAILVTFFWLIFYNQLFFLNHLISAIGAILFFIIIPYIFFVFTKKQSMGGGDIKLSFLLGLILGFPGIIVCLYVSFLTGGLASIILILWKKKAFLNSTIPFGPFLILGAIISLFFENQVLYYVLNLLGI